MTAGIAGAQPSVLTPASQAGLVDGRGRFREIFQAVMSRRRPASAVIPSIEDVLWNLSGEPSPQNRPVNLDKSRAGLRVVVVPGFLAECVADKTTAFRDSVANLEEQGYATDYIQTRGRRSSEHNAGIILKAVMGMPADEKILLVGHSKGVVDSMVALVSHSELAERVVALIGIAGAVNGSPLADRLPRWLLDFISRVPLPACPCGEGKEALKSLCRSVRLDWLSANTLPASVRYYSLAAVGEKSNMSLILRPFHAKLTKTDPLNDGMVMACDAIIPGSTLLGYPKADHLAVAMPFEGYAPFMAAAFVTRNAYPRSELLEAAVRFVEEDLTIRRAV